MNNNNYNKLFDSSFFSTPQKSDKENNEQKIFNPSQNIFSNAAASMGQNIATSGLPQSSLVPGGIGQGIFSPKAAPPGSASAGTTQGIGSAFVPGVFGGGSGLGTGAVANPALGNTSTGFATGGSSGPFGQATAPQGFGTANTSFSSVFGTGAGSTGARPVFSAPQANNIFGATTTPGINTGNNSAGFGGNYGFGATNQGQTAATLFGNTPPVSTATPSIFNTASTATPNLFGNNSTASPFGTGTSTSTSPFGTVNTAASGPFGAATATTTSSPFAKSTAPGVMSSPFGQAAFGQSSPAFATPTTLPSAPTPSVGFGGSAPLGAVPGSLMSQPSSFGQARPFSDFGPGVSKGTKDPKYQESRVREDTSFVNLKDICGMKEYQSKSISELRLEDFNLGRRRAVEVPQQPTPQHVPQALFMPAAQPVVQTSTVQPMQYTTTIQTAQQPGPTPGSQQTVFEKQANPNDPFLIDEIKIEKIELPVQPIKKKVPKPDFKREQAENMLKVVLREPAPHSEIETIPSQEDIKKMESTNLVIVFREGRIEYLEKIKAADAMISNIESKVFFNKDEVSVNDVVGVGLNKRARVYVNNYFPFSKKSRSFIKDEALIYELKRDPRRRFVEYDKESGLYVYEVNHF